MRGIPEETKARILEAATQLFYANGIRAIGVDAIAAEAGVTKRTLYKHFKSKDALIAAYLEGQHEPVLAALIRSVTRIKGDLVAQIEGLFLAVARQAENRDWHGCPFARAVSELRQSHDDVICRLAEKHKQAFEQWLEEHLTAGKAENPDLLARQIMVLLDGSIIQVLIHRDPAYALAGAEAAVALVRRQLSQ